MDEDQADPARLYVDEELVAALARAGGGRLCFDPLTGRLSHRRPTGGIAPVFVTAAEIRSLMAVLVLVIGEDDVDGSTLEHGVQLLLTHLDDHPVSAVLGWDHLRAAALVRDVGPVGDRWWTRTG